MNMEGETASKFEFLRLPNIAQNLIIEQLDFLSYIKLKSCSKAIANICNCSKRVSREFKVDCIFFRPLSGPYIPGTHCMSNCRFRWKNGDRLVESPWLALERNRDLGAMKSDQLRLSREYGQIDENHLINFMYHLGNRKVSAEHLSFEDADISFDVHTFAELYHGIDAKSVFGKCLLRIPEILDGGLLDMMDSITCLYCDHDPHCVFPDDLLIYMRATTLQMNDVDVHAGGLHDFFEEWQRNDREIDIVIINVVNELHEAPRENLLFDELDAVVVPGPVRPVSEHVSFMNNYFNYDKYSSNGVLWLIERPGANLFVHLENSPDPCRTSLICYQKLTK